MFDDYEDEFENMPIAHNKKELKRFKDFSRALQDAQSSRKDTVTSNINAAAQIATALATSSGVRHVVQRVISTSKDPRTRKETAVYVTDSIMKHVAKRADEGLLQRYEKHFQSHLRNFFKRALRMESTRYTLAERFLKKIITPWKAKGWFEDELEIVVALIYNTVPEMRERYGDTLLRGEVAYDDAGGGDDGGDDGGPVVESTPKRLRGATAKAGAPATPVQPSFLSGLTTPRPLFPGTPVVPKAAGNSDVLLSLPRTPRFDNLYARIPGTPAVAAETDSKIPMTPAAGTPAAMTPGAFACGTPAAQTPGAFANSTPGFQAPTPGRSTPGTPAFAPFTPGAMGPPPGTPRGLVAPFTPGAIPPGTPRGMAAPFTPGRGPAAPFTPGACGAAPFTPGGAVAPFTPGGPAAPFTPGVLNASAVPGTPRALLPPGTPGAMPFTPRPGMESAPVTPAFFGVRRPAPGTPAFAPVAGGDAAPRTPAGLQDSQPTLPLKEEADKFHGNANAIPGTP